MQTAYHYLMLGLQGIILALAYIVEGVLWLALLWAVRVSGLWLYRFVKSGCPKGDRIGKTYD